MISENKNLTTQEYIDELVNDIINDYRRNFSNGEEKEYGINVPIAKYSVPELTENGVRLKFYANDTAYCRMIIKDCEIISKKYFYMSFGKQSKYDFISSKEIFEKLFEENDGIYWDRCW